MTKETRCDFCHELIEPDENKKVGDAPRVRVTDCFDTYAQGTREAVLHRDCWAFVKAALPLLLAIRDQHITPRLEAAPAPSDAVRDPSHESDRGALDLLSDDDLEARLQRDRAAGVPGSRYVWTKRELLEAFDVDEEAANEARRYR